MRFHKMMVNRAIYGPNMEKVMEPAQVLAEPSETMGIYKDDGDGYDRYIVSHIPTGYKVTGTQTQRAARELIGCLLALGIDWRETDPDKLKDTLSSSARGSVMDIVNDYRGQ